MNRATVVAGVVLAFLSPLGRAQRDSSAGSERVQSGHDLWIQPNERASDATCFGCSIHVRGTVTGDAFAMGGRIIVETGGSIAGDAATLFGDIAVESGGSVSGDVAALGGRVRRSPEAVIGGEAASLGVVWMALLLLVPLVLLGLLVALLVWLVQRLRQRPVATAARV